MPKVFPLLGLGNCARDSRALGNRHQIADANIVRYVEVKGPAFQSALGDIFRQGNNKGQAVGQGDRHDGARRRCRSGRRSRCRRRCWRGPAGSRTPCLSATGVAAGG